MMTLPQIVSRNQIQKTNKRIISPTIDVLQPTTWYTCPANKIAILTGSCVCQGLGAAALTNLEAAGVDIAEWLAAGGTNPDLPLNLVTGFVFQFKTTLNATESLITTQDSGTNAEFTLQFEIEEFIV